MNEQRMKYMQQSDIFIIIKIMFLRNIKRLARFSNIRQKIRQERETRLGNHTVNNVLPVQTVDNLEKIRNIGIIAHIDAGKTTSTERMLYYAGALPSPGQIQQGTTTMDYMPQQKQRGITIRSAAISFNWKDHQFNLIDTPGHVDFSAEVTRSLQVLDGVVTIIDAVKGVQAQTIKVWGQANFNQLPKLCFANKMDRIGSSIIATAESIKKRLNAQPFLMQIPIGDGDQFRGLIDLVTMQNIYFKGKYGEEVQYQSVKPTDERYKSIIEGRNSLIEKIGGYDDAIADLYLQEKPISSKQLKQAIRRVLLNPKYNQNVCAVFLGSAYRNKGLQPLMDAVIDYLPSPTQKNPIENQSQPNTFRKPIKSQLFTGYVFKMIYDLQKGPLAYTRIYSGVLKKGIQLLNSTQNIPQKIGAIYRVRANQYVNVNEVLAGDIVALSGMKNTVSGDTLINLNDPIFLMKTINLPTPVFVTSLVLESQKYQQQLQLAMKKTVIEDSSINYKLEEDTGQLLVSGLGQLHLEILRDRLVSQGIPVAMGNIKINYKESVTKQITKNHQINRELKNGEIEQFHLQIQIKLLRDQNNNIIQANKISFEFEKDSQFDECWEMYLKKKTTKFMSRKKQSYDTVEEMKASLSAPNPNSQVKRFIKNPTPVQPIFNQGDEQDDEQPYYHINTLPFETLYELRENLRISLLYGKYNLPLIGVQLNILDGKYKKQTFTKPVMNQCASQLVRSCIEEVSVMLEPIMEVNFKGESNMIQITAKDIIKKRGRIQQQQENSIKGYVPAEGVKGWVKQLRSMGVEVDIKLSGYEEVQAINPSKLLQQNMG